MSHRPLTDGAYEAGYNRGLTGSECPLSREGAVALIPASIDPLSHSAYIQGWEDGLRNRERTYTQTAAEQRDADRFESTKADPGGEP